MSNFTKIGGVSRFTYSVSRSERLSNDHRASTSSDDTWSTTSSSSDNFDDRLTYDAPFHGFGCYDSNFSDDEDTFCN